MFNRKAKTTAQIVDNALVVTVPDAETPCLWRMDLAAAQAARLTLKDEEGRFALVFSGAGGDQTIARYAVRDNANAAFSAVSKALTSGSALLPGASGGGSFVKTMIYAFLFCIIAYVAYVGVKAFNSIPLPGQPPAAGMGEAPKGVPGRADDFLPSPDGK